ncbi:MAG: sigma-54-dependent transcriptional regulator [Burkholderiales bacterium]
MKHSERRGEGRVLVVDDEPDIRELLELTLVKMGVEVVSVGSVGEARRHLGAGGFDLCLTDMRLPDGEGLELVRYVGTLGGDPPIAVITAYGSADNAVAALKAGAFDYVSKPVGLEQVRSLVKSALSLPDRAEVPARNHRLIGVGPAMRQVRDLIVRLARTQAPVYISGESGSGKELAARLIHDNGARHAGPFVPVNCGAIPENLMESEFFGHRKGAFTGATHDREGFFQAASGGTLFLDEVAELPVPMQVKLLRAIQEKRVRKIGATQEDAVDVRILSATHQNLAACVEEGRFRQDLFYRLNVIELRMPPLRECREDIPTIAASVLQRLVAQNGVAPKRLSEGALQALERYDFPGNVRELENILERAVALSPAEEILVEDLQLGGGAPSATALPADEAPRGPLPEYLERVEREAILEALGKTGFNRTAAARLLGVSFRTLRYRMQRLGIKDGRDPAAGGPG